MLTCVSCNKTFVNKIMIKRHERKCAQKTKELEDTSIKENVKDNPKSKEPKDDPKKVRSIHLQSNLNDPKDDQNDKSIDKPNSKDVTKDIKDDMSKKKKEASAKIVKCINSVKYDDGHVSGDKRKLEESVVQQTNKKRRWWHRSNKQEVPYNSSRKDTTMQQRRRSVNLLEAYELKMKLQQKLITNTRWRYEVLSAQENMLVDVLISVKDLKTVCDVLKENLGIWKQIMFKI